jgi:hypothetical protein
LSTKSQATLQNLNIQFLNDGSSTLQINPWREEWKSAGELGLEGDMAQEWARYTSLIDRENKLKEGEDIILWSKNPSANTPQD